MDAVAKNARGRWTGINIITSQGLICVIFALLMLLCGLILFCACAMLASIDVAKDHECADS